MRNDSYAYAKQISQHALSKTGYSIDNGRASSRENHIFNNVCKHQKRRSACASTQSDQRFWIPFYETNYDSTCYMQNFDILASLCS